MAHDLNIFAAFFPMKADFFRNVIGIANFFRPPEDFHLRIHGQYHALRLRRNRGGFGRDLIQVQPENGFPILGQCLLVIDQP